MTNQDDIARAEALRIAAVEAAEVGDLKKAIELLAEADEILGGRDAA